MYSDHDFINTILARRSIRIYREDPVRDADIEKLLKAGMAAPSACCKDPWRFVVVKSRETLQAIAAVLPNGKMLSSAGAGIVVCGDSDAAHDNQLSYLLQDCAAAIENILLAAHALSLGACWLGVHPREDRINNIRTILSIPDAVFPVACLSIGYPAEVKEPRTRYSRRFVHYEKW